VCAGFFILVALISRADVRPPASLDDVRPIRLDFTLFP
jgi:hypothetical protein